MKCLENNNECHCEGVKRPWQSQSASDVYNKESETPLTAVSTLTALLRNSTKVMENLSQKVALCKVLSISVITLFFSLVTIGNTRAEEINCKTGQQSCGTNCCWSIENKTLKITGGADGSIGVMNDYYLQGSPARWYNTSPWKDADITAVDVQGVSYIGNGAFGGELKNITEATIGDTVKHIGSQAFDSSGLTTIKLPKNLEIIEGWAFSATELNNIEIPDTVTAIGGGAFWATTPSSVIIPDNAVISGHYDFGNNLADTQIICRGTVETCDALMQKFKNYCTDTSETTCSPWDLSGNFVLATGELCNSEKYYWNGEQCLREENPENRTCVEGWYKQENYCAMYLCEYYNKLSSCSESIVGCAKTVCEEDGSLADGTPCYKEVEQSIAPSCGENAHLVDNESTCACICNSGYTGDGATCTAINCAAGEFWNGEQCAACADETYSAGGFVTECSANTAEHCASKSNTANVCASCAANYFMDGTTCTAINCSAGEFFDISAKVCTPCVEGEWNDVAAATSCMPNTAANCATYSKTANVCASCAAKFKLADNECVMMMCAEVYPDSSETQCESSISGCSVTTCSEVGSLADGTPCYRSATVDHTPNCDSNATLTGEGAECACVCNTGFEGSGTSCTAISCPAGKYLDGSECKPCAAGSYAEAGDNVCSSCGAHEYSAAGASSCSPRNNMSSCSSFATDSDECTSCNTGYKQENGGCVSICNGGKVFWDGECYDEYPFAKKRYTPAEADQWLKDDGNIVTLIFKK